MVLPEQIPLRDVPRLVDGARDDREKLAPGLSSSMANAKVTAARPLYFGRVRQSPVGHRVGGTV